MVKSFDIPEFDRFVIFVAVLILLYIVKPSKTRSIRTSDDSQLLSRPPSSAGVFIAKSIVISIVIIASSVLIQYSEAIIDYENDQCEETKHRSKQRCDYRSYTSNELSNQVAGFLLNEEVETGFDIGQHLSHGHGTDGPWFWLYYTFGGLVMITGFRLAQRRRKLHLHMLKSIEEKLRPIIRQLANDPRGVVEGRIQMPPTVQPSTPTSRERRRSVLILFFCGLISIVTLMSFFDFFYAMEFGLNMNPRHNTEAVLLSAMALGFNISGHTAVKYLSATYPGETVSGFASGTPLPGVGRSDNAPNKVTSAKEVLAELANEMRATRVESEMLRVQLNETRIQVSSLESELERKAAELEAIQALTNDMERIIKQGEDSSSKNLSLMDSVLVGDPLFNGDKIDKQVVNDPKAIAKAAIEAYKAGRTDVKAAELDF